MSTEPHGRQSLKLDTARLRQFLRREGLLPGGELAVTQLKGGQSNPTYLLALDGRPSFVLRKKPPGNLLPSAHAVDREFRVMRALAGSDVPVPEMLLYCDDEEVVGTAFFVMEYIAGRTFWDPALPELEGAERGPVHAEMVRVLAALHAVDPVAVGLEDFGRPGNYFARQIGRWTRQYRASETEPIEAMDELAAWLPEHIPEGDETAIVHGDFRLDNVLFDSVEPRAVAVLDWELSTLGHPLADLAYHVMAWRVPAGLRGLGGLDLPALGIPTEAEHVASYLARSGLASFTPQAWEFAMAYNLFRVAAIRQGVMRRALDGNAASERAIEAGARARQAAEIGWRIAAGMEKRGNR